ncbi:Hypothetical Protein FCC1311_053942 [Hondaea fermentalgiana]|uniref:Uncharacterized protein n=1 Tax=Hondaea fermentalgiana TaxID=2315210 RepID=A0A2R5GE05_9STRA|nr:Hypothetical Protein FCC1311_053942 [Hondaea fermentalgiana]|eukprot:GBG29172.1 Hypothetical Protein FCC1311_053942 [Hondaea fermentalgiana]
MAFLLAGMALGATAVALSESDRQYYRSSRYAMDYLGNKNGQDIYKDRVTGLFYCDDGWDVRRVGTAGWRAHPVDLERLKSKLAKYSHEQLKFSEYILASFAGHENRLWETIFRRFEQPKEPKKPHFGKGIRKQRWGKYDEEVEEWEKEVAEAKKLFKVECEEWDKKKASFDASVNHAASGSELLKRALAPVAESDVEIFKIVVPQGKQPGDTLVVQAGGRNLQVMVPPGSAAGSEIQFEVPKPKAIVIEAQQAPARRAPQPAIGGVISRRAPTQSGATTYGGAMTRRPGAPRKHQVPNEQPQSAYDSLPIVGSAVPPAALKAQLAASGPAERPSATADAQSSFHFEQ